MRKIFTLFFVALFSVGLWATDYYYHGDLNEWGGTKMTAGKDGYYYYYPVAAGMTASKYFKITEAVDNYDTEYNKYNLNIGYNGTNINKTSGDGALGGKDDPSKDIWIYNTEACYILFYPESEFNTTGKAVICAATYLPDSRSCTVYFVKTDNNWDGDINAHVWYDGVNSKSVDKTTWPGQELTATGITYQNNPIYSYTFSETCDKIIFSHNDGKDQTADLTLSHTNAGNMYVYGTDWAEYATDGYLTLVAGTGGKVSLTGSSWSAQTTVSSNVNTAVNIYAQADEGYTFSTWTKKAGTGSIGSNVATTTYNLFINSLDTVEVSFTETMSTLTTSNSYDKGDPEYAVPTKSVSSIGMGTTAEITATAAGEGYEFVGWTLTNCTRTDEGSETATTITVRSNGDGAAASAVANYEEVLTSTWYLVGLNESGKEIFPSGWNSDANSMMLKVTGKADQKIVYKELTVSVTDNTYVFKVKNGETWYGYSKNDYLEWTATDTKTVYTGDDNPNNLKFTPTYAGKYEFKVDYSGAYPAVTITYPAGPPTAIDEAVAGKKAVKRIVNGQLVIEREGKLFNALGAEVK